MCLKEVFQFAIMRACSFGRRQQEGRVAVDGVHGVEGASAGYNPSAAAAMAEQVRCSVAVQRREALSVQAWLPGDREADP